MSTVSKHLTLSKMAAGQSGIVVEILGGQGVTRRLEAMGIRRGRKVVKISSMLLRGAVTLQVDSTRLAIGFGMANKILVDVDASN